MGVKQFGSGAFTGLNIKSASHLIQDHELVESVNGWTAEDGTWQCAPRPKHLYDGTAIVAYCASLMDDGVVHHVWLDGSTLYDNGSSVGTIANVGSDMSIREVDGVFLILGATKNWIYGPDHLREQGSWQPERATLSLHQYDPTAYVDVNDITKANPGVVTTDSAHALSTGNWVYIDNVAGMTEVNGKMFQVTVLTSTTFEINEDTSSHSAYTSAGDLEVRANLVGDYKFYITCTVELDSGVVLESKPRGLQFDIPYSAGGDDNWAAEAITLAATDAVRTFGGERVYWEYDSADLFDITGTIGMNYFPGLRLYRTKANGYDIYLEKSWRYGDSDLTWTDSGSSTVAVVDTYWVGAPDNQLGAVLDYDFNDHTNPPQSDLSTFVGQRNFLANGSYLHWSTFDGIEYYSDSGNALMWADITALGTYRDYCIIFSVDRMWALRMINGFPDIEEIDTPVGTTYPKAVTSTSQGLMFLREDGLWLFNGGRVDKVSRGAFDSIASPQSVVEAGDLIYVSGSEKAYIGQNRGDSWVWHESSHYLPYASATNGKLYGAGSTTVSEMFAGVAGQGSFKTKDWGGFDATQTYKLEMDVEGSTIPRVIVNGNTVSGTSWHDDDTLYSQGDRRIVWTHLPRVQGNFVNVECEVTGDAKVRGLRGSVER